MADLEHLVVERIAGFLRDRTALHDALEPFEPDAVVLEAVLFAAIEAEQRLLSGTREEARALLLKLLSRIEVLPHQVRLSIHSGSLFELSHLAAAHSTAAADLELAIPVRMFRRAREVRLAIAPGAAPDAPAKDPALIKLIAKAWAAREALLGGEGSSLQEVAAASHMEPGYLPCW